MQNAYCDLPLYLIFSLKKHCALCNSMKARLTPLAGEGRRKSRTGEEYK
jgi:hypothetical protein